jgi:hypothetical protein
MGLSAQLAFFEVRALVFFLSKQDLTSKRRLIIEWPQPAQKFFSR